MNVENWGPKTLYEEAKDMVIKNQTAKACELQRGLKIGWARAQRILEQLEKEGVIGPYDENGVRKVLVKP